MLFLMKLRVSVFLYLIPYSLFSVLFLCICNSASSFFLSSSDHHSPLHFFPKQKFASKSICLSFRGCATCIRITIQNNHPTATPKAQYFLFSFYFSILYFFAFQRFLLLPQLISLFFSLCFFLLYSIIFWLLCISANVAPKL